jgi:hypothetical protein
VLSLVSILIRVLYVYVQGPIPKFDPAFMVQGLLGYSQHKAATGQVMTKWDHNVRSWMENVVATAYGIAPVLAWSLDDISTPIRT